MVVHPAVLQLHFEHCELHVHRKSVTMWLKLAVLLELILPMEYESL